MDLQATVESLCGFAGRSAGSDAERRAADWLRDRAGAGKRDAELEVHWVRPHWSTIHLVHALAGVVGSLVSTASAIAGVAIVAVVDAAAAAVVAPAAAPVVVDDLESLPHAATPSNDSAQLARAMRERFTPVVRCDASRG